METTETTAMLYIIIINTKNCSLPIVLTATDQKQKISVKFDRVHPVVYC